MLQRLATSDNTKGMNAGSLTSKPKFISKKTTNKKEGSEEKIPRAFKNAYKHHNNGTINRKKQGNPIGNGINTNENPNGKKQGNPIGKTTRLAAPSGLYARNKDVLVNTQMKYNPIGEVTLATSPAGLFTKKRTYNPIGNITKTATPSKLCSRNCRSMEA